MDLLPRRVYRYDVRLTSVLDLTDETNLEKLELRRADISSDDALRCQAVGDAAHYAGFEALVAPSASGTGTILAVFFDQIQAGSVVEPVDFRDWMTLP